MQFVDSTDSMQGCHQVASNSVMQRDLCRFVPSCGNK